MCRTIRADRFVCSLLETDGRTTDRDRSNIVVTRRTLLDGGYSVELVGRFCTNLGMVGWVLGCLIGIASSICGCSLVRSCTKRSLGVCVRRQSYRSLAAESTRTQGEATRVAGATAAVHGGRQDAGQDGQPPIDERSPYLPSPPSRQLTRAWQASGRSTPRPVWLLSVRHWTGVIETPTRSREGPETSYGRTA